MVLSHLPAVYVLFLPFTGALTAHLHQQFVGVPKSWGPPDSPDRPDRPDGLLAGTQQDFDFPDRPDRPDRSLLS